MRISGRGAANVRQAVEPYNVNAEANLHDGTFDLEVCLQ